jgi:hypothetical protein
VIDAFISHSSANRSVAVRLEKALEAGGLSVWLDDSEIRLGVLLGKELRDSIRNARVLLLLWSEEAAASRWVNTEWLTAFLVRRFIVPCSLDSTPLPQCLQNSVYLRIKRVTPTIVERLVRAIREAPKGANPLASAMSAQGPKLSAAIGRIWAAQEAIGVTLARSDIPKAIKQQAQLDPIVAEARASWPLDPVLINLVGYHLKNAYMIKYWDAVQAGRGPRDPLLDEAERRFMETLSLDPTDPSPLNGLGSILTFKRDLEAAEFFIRAALAEAKRRGTPYPDAEGDLELVRFYRRIHSSPR